MFFILLKSFKLFFLRERVILTKIVRMSSDVVGDEEDFIEYTNASLSKTLAKNFKQVTIHQQAKDGKISKICIYASLEKLFSFPSTSSVLSRLTGICKTLGLEIQPFTKDDFKEHKNDLNLNYGDPVPYQLSGLLLLGEPAYQHIKLNTTPIDILVESIVKKSKSVEIHTFNSIRQGSKFRFLLRKIFNPRTRDRYGKERTLSKTQQHRLSETEDMASSGYVNGEVVVLVKGKNLLDVETIHNEMYGSLETIYNGFVRKIKLKDTSPKRISHGIKQHELVGGHHNLISGYSARSIINIYRKPVSGIHLSKDVVTPPSFERPQETHLIELGETITGEVIRASMQDHIHHCGIFGTTGYGKSEWIQSEIEQIMKFYPEKRIMIFDFDGEYSQAFINHPDFLILEANNSNAPLLINPFQDEFADSTEHADSLFKYFNEILNIDQRFSEFTPPQKTMLWEGIIATIEQEEIENKNYNAFERNLKQYVEEHQREFVRGDMSIISLLNKMRFYKRELRNIIMCQQSNFTMDMLENTNIVFNLRKIRNEIGKRAIATLILYQLRNYMLKQDTRELWIKIYIEEATVVTPRNPFKGQMYFVEELLNVIRKHGASITLIGTTSDEITKFILESKYLVNIGCVSEELCKKMNTDIKTQHSLKKFQLDVKLPDEEYPIRLVQLTRPQRRKLSEDEYEFFIKTSPKYELLSDKALLLEEPEIDPEVSKYSIIEECFKDCTFNFLERKQCILRKSNKLIQTLQEAIGEFVREDCNGWGGVKELFDTDLHDAIDGLSIIISNSVSDNAKFGRRTITSEDKNNLLKCAFTWILQGLVQELKMSQTEIESYFVDYAIALEQLQTSSPYGFDEDNEKYQFNTGGYDDYWGES